MKLRGSKLSVVAICRNERENLVPFLQSAGAVADEIVIVDTGSVDGTVEMLHRYGFKEKGGGRGLKLRRFTWCDDFAAARNFALSHATGDWVLWMDLDDRLEESAPDYIIPLINGPRRDLAFAFQTVSLTEREGEYIRHLMVRLFPRIKGIRWEGKIHETLGESLRESGIAIEPVRPCIVIHYGYQSPKMTAAKALRNAKILEKVEGKTCIQYHELGDAYLQMGQALDLAVVNFQRGKAVAEREDQRHKITERLVTAMMFMGNVEGAKAELQDLQEGSLERAFWEGETSWMEKRYNEAKPRYESVLAGTSEVGFIASYADAYKSVAKRRLAAMEVQNAEKGSPGE